jgi:short-chain fatty acids transporter
MIARLGLGISRVFRSVVPDPFVIAVLLTLLTAILALVFGTWPDDAGIGHRAVMLLDSWRSASGIWKLLEFSMQMCLVLVTGHALADAPATRRALQVLADIPPSTPAAAALVGLVACAAAVVNWGLGLIAGAILAREVGRSFARRAQPLHYPLIVAAGYTGLMVWHGGLSGSAPLSMTSLAQAAKVLPESTLKALGDTPVPLSESILAPLNLVITGGLLIIVPLMLLMLSPRNEADFSPPPHFAEGRSFAQRREVAESFPDRLERSFVVMLALALPLTLALVRFFQTRSLMQFGLAEFITFMLALGLLLHGSLKSYAQSIDDASRGCAGIILQFPLYAGIMNMMESSGLVRSLAEGIASVADSKTLPLLTMLSASVVNLFVPSGGGQWAVQGPIALQSGITTGAPLGKMVMAVAYGDQLTNMLQPFWALPLLAITHARARDIVGYCAMVMFAGGIWISAWLLVL